MAPYRQAPPPDWVGWGADVPYTPENAPLSGGYQWDENYDDLTDPAPYTPPRSTTPPGQFLISLLEAQKRLPKPVPPGRFLPSIGVHLPQPQTMLPMRPFFPPPPPLTPLEPAVDYTGMTAPAPMVPPERGEHSTGFGATPSRMPAEFERTQGDGVILNTTAGANEVIYDTLGLPVDAMTWLLNQGLRGVNYAAGSDLRIRDPFLGSRWFAHRGASVGVRDPASIVAVTPAERIARGTGAGAAFAVAPATIVRGGAAFAGRQLGPLGQTVFGRAGSAGELGRDMTIGATAGGTGMAAAELVPEPWKPTAMVVGGLLGGAAAAVATGPRVLATGRGSFGDLALRSAQKETATQAGDPLAISNNNVGRTVPFRGYRDSTYGRSNNGGMSLPENGEMRYAVEVGPSSGSAQKFDFDYRSSRRDKASIVRENHKVGRAFESHMRALLSRTQDTQPEITLRSKGPSGVKVRYDFVGIERETGDIKLSEAKSSPTAPFTKGQKVGYTEIGIHGGSVVGRGKYPFIKGFEVPPTLTDVYRKMEDGIGKYTYR